jgi:uncharacterized damage-inducible protein DinB
MTDTWAHHFRFLARYNLWANARLYEVCAALPESEYQRPRPAFFGSIHGTLSHLLVGDLVWFARFSGEAPGVSSLDEQPHDSLTDLRPTCVAQDEKIIAYVSRLRDHNILGTVSYATLGASRRPIIPSKINRGIRPDIHFGAVIGTQAGGTARVSPFSRLRSGEVPALER